MKRIISRILIIAIIIAVGLTMLSHVRIAKVVFARDYYQNEHTHGRRIETVTDIFGKTYEYRYTETEWEESLEDFLTADEEEYFYISVSFS